MTALNRQDLWSLEEYAELRPDFRQRVMAHKRQRQLALGDHARLYFEDRMTIQYQIQEMLRIEKVFDAEGIQDELDAYNPLIPDGLNWKCTFMLEYDDENERRQKTSELVGIEHTLWLQVDGFAAIFPICNEDMERSDEHKTSTVHFMRFELSKEMAAAVKSGASISAGINHKGLQVSQMKLPKEVRDSLANDLISPASCIH